MSLRPGQTITNEYISLLSQKKIDGLTAPQATKRLKRCKNLLKRRGAKELTE